MDRSASSGWKEASSSSSAWTARTPDQDVKGIEYIGFDEDTETLRSHYMDTRGSNFAYTWEVDGDTIRIWFGDKGSNNFFQGRFSEGGNSYSGRWQWPGGGYEATLRRTHLTHRMRARRRRRRGCHERTATRGLM
jgi:hypothetical protein